jgi:DNA-binding response OmpR family regulator
MKILIVDDDEGVLIRLERALEAEGYSTTTAWSGKEALSIARKSHFDMLLVDEYLSDLASPIVVEELKRLQPDASLLLMDTQGERGKDVSHSTMRVVCKWKDDEVKKRIQDSLAA